MKYAERLKSLRVEREKFTEKMNGLIEKAEQENRELNAEEQELFNTAESEIEAIDKRIENVTKLVENTVAEKGAAPLIQTDSLGNKPKKREPGIFLAKAAQFLKATNGASESAARMAERSGDKEMGAIIRATVGAGDTATPSWAGELVEAEAQGFIDMLRPKTVYGSIPGSTSFSLTGTDTIRVPRQTGGVSGGWMTEGGAIPVKAASFDSVLLQPHKLGVISVVTNELLMRSDPKIDRILRDSMVRDAATVLDQTFLSDVAGTGGAPSGILHTSNAAAPLTPSNTGNAVDDALADLHNILSAAYTANVGMMNGTWLMHDATRLKLQQLRSATGAFYFADELATGKLMGYPVVTSTSVDQSDVIMIDGDTLLTATGMMPQISLSSEASVHMDDAPSSDIGGATTVVQSFFQSDMTGIRFKMEVDFRTRHDEAIQWVDAITW